MIKNIYNISAWKRPRAEAPASNKKTIHTIHQYVSFPFNIKSSQTYKMAIATIPTVPITKPFKLYEKQ